MAMATERDRAIVDAMAESVKRPKGMYGAYRESYALGKLCEIEGMSAHEARISIEGMRKSEAYIVHDPEPGVLAEKTVVDFPGALDLRYVYYVAG